MSRNQQFARVLFALGMVSLGILALVYGDLALVWYSVPAWVPWRAGVAYASGVVLSCYARRAGMMEAALWSVFTRLVLVPAVLAAPTSLPQWTEFLISWAITAGAWVVAESMTAKDSTKTGRIAAPIT